MIYNTDALVLKARDYRENDKILTLFSPELGKISGVLKGVKKANAKLKFAGEPFCFAEFEFVKKGEMTTFTNCSEKESFFEIRQDIESFYCGSAVLEIVNLFAQENLGNPELFVVAIRALKHLTLKKILPHFVIVKFVLLSLGCFGQKLDFKTCVCGKNADVMKFDFESGGVLCGDCDVPYSSSIDSGVRKVLDSIDKFDYESLNTYNCSEVLMKKTILFLNELFLKNFKRINSLKQLTEI